MTTTRRLKDSKRFASFLASVLIFASSQWASPVAAQDLARAPTMTPAPAQTSAPIRKRQVVHTITTSVIGDASAADYIGHTNVLKRLLEQHGYRTDRCEMARLSMQELQRRTTTLNQQSYGAYDRRAFVVAQQQCAVPGDDVELLEAVLTLSEDKAKGRKGASLIFYSSEDKPPYVGGFFNKRDEDLDWDDVLSRAIARTLSGINDATSIQLAEIPTVVVGETVRLIAVETWDPDGDPFELIWKVTTTACVGPGTRVPVTGRACPGGSRKATVKIEGRKSKRDLSVEFVPPMVGRYDVSVQARIGNRTEPAVHYSVFVDPKRTNEFFSRVAVLRLPTNFVRDSGKQELSLFMGVGYLRRVTHRIGLFGYHEDISLGASLNSFQPLEDWSIRGSDTGTFLQAEGLAKALDPTGTYGLATALNFGGGPIVTQRKIEYETEWAWAISTFVGGYLSTGSNYLARRETLCRIACPAFTFGPTLSFIQNVSVQKHGLVGGLEGRMEVEF